MVVDEPAVLKLLFFPIAIGRKFSLVSCRCIVDAESSCLFFGGAARMDTQPVEYHHRA
jgi:hypothetical protein